MAYDRRSFAGAAIATTLDGAIDGSTLSITIAASTGWPSGSNGDFFVVIDRGTATEEKVRVASRTSLSLTVATGGRGADGTSGVAHSSGAAIELCLSAVDLDEANAHIADTTLDHHTQYLNTTRHDVEARHTFGSALGTPATPASIGTANATGSGDNPAREDHVHEIGTGAIDTAAQFAAGVVDAAALASNAVTNAKVADNAIDTAELVDAAVATAKIEDAAVTAAKLATSLARSFTVADATARGALTDLREGDTCWQQDTDKRFFYTGAAWRYVPGQQLAYAEVTANQENIAADTDLTSLSVTFDALGGSVKVEAGARFRDTCTLPTLRLREGSTTLDDIDKFSALGTGESAKLKGTSATLTPSSGSHTYKLTFTCTAGTPDLIASSTELAYIRVVTV